MKRTLTIYPVPSGTMNFDKHWYKNNPVKSHFFNALSTLFPQGESYFIWSIKNLADQAKSPELKMKIQDFIVQEKNHAALHKAYNRRLARLGYNLPWMEKTLYKKLKFTQDHLDARSCLAVTVATEHLTAVLGEKILEGHLLQEGADPEVRKLWIWHAMEEVDHKSVAMDLFQEVGGSYFKRARAMFLVNMNFWGDTFIFMLHMLWKDKLLLKFRTWLQIFSLFFGKGGIVRLFTLDVLKFFAFRFHPDQTNNYNLVEQGQRFLQSAAR